MSETTEISVSAPRCQGRPAAARPAYRKDMLCASQASTVVQFRGVEMPVCRMHQATYERWGDDAEENAERLWHWRDRASAS